MFGILPVICILFMFVYVVDPFHHWLHIRIFLEYHIFLIFRDSKKLVGVRLERGIQISLQIMFIPLNNAEIIVLMMQWKILKVSSRSTRSKKINLFDVNNKYIKKTSMMFFLCPCHLFWTDLTLCQWFYRSFWIGKYFWYFE